MESNEERPFACLAEVTVKVAPPLALQAMTQAVTLSKIGSRVKVDLDRVRDRISSSLIQQLNLDPRGKVIGYKMTDGNGIGIVLELSNGTTSWFFGDEIGRA